MARRAARIIAHAFELVLSLYVILFAMVLARGLMRPTPAVEGEDIVWAVFILSAWVAGLLLALGVIARRGYVRYAHRFRRKSPSAEATGRAGRNRFARRAELMLAVIVVLTAPLIIVGPALVLSLGAVVLLAIAVVARIGHQIRIDILAEPPALGDRVSPETVLAGVVAVVTLLVIAWLTVMPAPPDGTEILFFALVLVAWVAGVALSTLLLARAVHGRLSPLSTSTSPKSAPRRRNRRNRLVHGVEMLLSIVVVAMVLAWFVSPLARIDGYVAIVLSWIGGFVLAITVIARSIRKNSEG